MSISFLNRDFTPRGEAAPQLAVERCTWQALGGCAESSLVGWVGRTPADQLFDLLRCPVLVSDETGSPVWWGLVTQVEVRQGAVGMRASLDDFASRIAVVYTDLAADQGGGGRRAQTAWADNAQTAAEYGWRERLYFLPRAAPWTAEAWRDRLLASQGQVGGRPFTAAAAAPAAPTLRLGCRGWWWTSDWRFYTQPAGREQHTADRWLTQDVGMTVSNTRLAQQVTVSAGGWRAEEAWVLLRRVGSPADLFKLDLCADSAGSPGVVLASASLPGGQAPADFRWTRLAFASQVVLGAGMYWLQASRSGANDPANEYRLAVDPLCGYAGGVLRLWNGSAWSPRAPDADLLFRLAGQKETSQQLADLFAPGAGGQFLSGVTVETPSGIYANPCRGGERTALAEALDLLQTGTAAGQEYLAWVTPGRWLRIFPRPNAASAAVRVGPDGLLRDALGHLLPARSAPVGQWAVADGAWSAQGVGEALVSDRVFLDHVALDAQGRLHPEDV